MGASVTPDVGALVLSGFAPSQFAVRPQGSSHFLLVLANPDAVTPYDPASTGLPGDEHIYFTTRRRADHPWIAQRVPGDPTSGPAIDIGGQKLELPLGRSVDGECQVRIIDVAAPVLACGLSVLVAEGDAGLDANAFTTGGWTVHETIVGSVSIGWGVNASGPFLSGHILFGSGSYDGYIEKTFNGTESGGPAWSPGQVVGVHFRVVWSLDTGPGNIFAELVGAGSNRISFPNGAYDFWSIDSSLDTEVYNGYFAGATDSNGEIKVRLGGENYGGSCNVNCSFRDLEFVECGPVPGGDDLYYTGMLADDDARQRTLGWPYFLKLSEDGGLTFTHMVYAGYHKRSTMERALTYLITGGDAGRGRRVSKAWSDLDPVEDWT